MCQNGTTSSPGDKQIEVSLPGDLYDELMLHAVLNGRTLEDRIVHLLAAHAALSELRQPSEKDLPT
jgi:hypothetical protein